MPPKTCKIGVISPFMIQIVKLLVKALTSMGCINSPKTLELTDISPMTWKIYGRHD